MTDVAQIPGDDSGPEWTPLAGKCNAVKRRDAGLCHRPAGWGTDHAGTGRCKLHGGSTRTHVARAQKAILKGRIGQALEDAGIALAEHEGDYVEALKSAVKLDQRMVVVLEAEVAALDELIQLNLAGGPVINPLQADLAKWNNFLALHSKIAADLGIDLIVLNRNLAIDTLYAQAFAAGVRAVVTGLATAAVEQAHADPGVIEALFTERVDALIGEALEVSSDHLGGGRQ